MLFVPALASAGVADATMILLKCSDCRLPLPAGRSLHLDREMAVARLLRSDTFPSANADARGLTDRSSTRTFASRSGGLTIEAARHLAKSPSLADRVGIPREKLSSATFTLRYATDLGGDDLVSFGVTGAREKRRFATDFSGGHLSTSLSAGVEASWLHGPNWRMTTGYRSERGSGRSNGFLRGIELASGATRSQHGPWAAIAFSPGDENARHDFSIGLRAQSMRLADSDRLAMGAPRSTDSRLALTASLRFR